MVFSINKHNNGDDVINVNYAPKYFVICIIFLFGHKSFVNFNVSDSLLLLYIFSYNLTEYKVRMKV